MKKHLFGTLMMLAVVFGMACFTTREASGPNCTLDKLSYNFGDVNMGELPTCTFTFTNTGSAPLILKSVEKPCGFKSVAFNQTPVSPGESGTITYTFETKNRPGRFRRTSVIKTNISDDPRFDLLVMMTGNVNTVDKRTAAK